MDTFSDGLAMPNIHLGLLSRKPMRSVCRSVAGIGKYVSMYPFFFIRTQSFHFASVDDAAIQWLKISGLTTTALLGGKKSQTASPGEKNEDIIFFFSKM